MLNDNPIFDYQILYPFFSYNFYSLPVHQADIAVLAVTAAGVHNYVTKLINCSNAAHNLIEMLIK